MNYEINFLVLQSKTENLPELRQKVKEIIQKLEGKITEEKEYSKRKLAYKIKNEGYGFHTVLRFTLEKLENLNQLKKDLNLEEKIARYLIVRADDLLTLSELEEKLKKASEEKTHLSQEELGKMLKEKKEEVAKPSFEESTPVEPEQKVLNQTISTPAEPMEEEAVPTEKELENAPEKNSSEAVEKTKKKTSKEEKLSMDELDKKLDEILNI